MFKFFKTKQNKQLNVEKQKSKIVACKFAEENNFWDNMWENPYILTTTFKVIGIDEKEYIVKSIIDGSRKLNILVYLEGERLKDVQLYGNFYSDSKTDFYFERIEHKNLQYKGFGWGTILMDCMMKTLNK